ncbi:MAG: ATPase [Bacillota bacterium]|nr:ATPase [Bacillota bacterium]
MRVEDLINELQNVISDAKNLPLTGGKSVIDTGRVLNIVDEIQGALPAELRQAKAIVADRAQIVSEAKQEAEEIIRNAEARRKAMINQSEIVRLAQTQSQEIMNDAKMKSAEMRKAANDYIDDIMRRTDELITNQLNEIKKTRQSLKSSQRN